jgi:multicomponent Na+:H+ antiporter subunit E
MLYVPWLVWEIVASGLQVAYVVLHPRMPIAPGLVRIRVNLPHTLANLTLANSITLTPGTVTLDVDGDEFLVHALTPASARGIELGEIQSRVATLFSTADARPAEGERP